MSEQEPVKVVDRRWWARTEDTPASDSEPVVFDKPSYVQELEQKLAEKDAQLQEYVTLVHEAQREFDAMRARVRKDAARDAEMSRRSVFADLLEVIDNLDRALAAARAGGSADHLVQGVELVRQQFLHKLARLRHQPARAARRAVRPRDARGRHGRARHRPVRRRHRRRRGRAGLPDWR